MTLQPFIVQLTVSVDDFRDQLTTAVSEASIVRELSRGQVVVAAPAGRERALRALPGVAAVTPDTLQHKLSPRASAG